MDFIRSREQRWGSSVLTVISIWEPPYLSVLRKNTEFSHTHWGFAVGQLAFNPGDWKTDHTLFPSQGKDWEVEVYQAALVRRSPKPMSQQIWRLFFSPAWSHSTPQLSSPAFLLFYNQWTANVWSNAMPVQGARCCTSDLPQTLTTIWAVCSPRLVFFFEINLTWRIARTNKQVDPGHGG